MSETKALAPSEEIRGQLNRMKEQFKLVLPPQIDVDRFTRIAVTAIQNTPALVKCDRHSLYGAFMKAAQAGLLPDGKEAAIVPFKDQAVFIAMTEGILKQVRNSGELKSITSQVVFENDKFRYWVDENGEHLEHEPNWFTDRGKRRGVYALATTKDGGVYVEVLSEKQVMDIKNVSRAKDGPAWTGQFDGEMWRKSAIRRLSKRLPKSTDLEGAIAADDDLFMPPSPTQPATHTEPAPEAAEEKKPRQTKTSKLVGEAMAKDVTPPEAPKAESELANKGRPYNHAPGADNPPPQNEQSPI